MAEDLVTVAVEPEAALETRLTGDEALKEIAKALREAALVFEPEDLVTLTAAETLTITDDDDYTRGFDLLAELTAIEDRIAAHYARFDKPLNHLIGVVRSVKGPQVKQVTPLKQALSKRLGTWKAAADAAAALAAEKAQAVKDAEARAAQEARAAVLDRVAAAEPDPKLAQSFQAEADAVRATVETIKGAPVEVAPAVPKIQGGHTRTTWKCEFVDLKALLTAYVEGKVFLDEQAIMDGLQASMDRQAVSLQHNLAKAFPGTRAVPTHGAVMRRK